ncbi:DNA polymerase domain-containing protein [Aeromicrobium sp. 50.2.37]|uniref:DNA polymerase domain-containing protein n=1 Tax=Aeromicrobium sp. 50.2.37 TaxID=2969305 RepID=UPI00215003DB|nr:DNA primase small subunit domain-containing protein [Aeromicrobium sp. 50.2.37]MCR4511905.1 ATP-dependent DNA ligase [Aeromicrobium sp. 50.2.37]
MAAKAPAVLVDADGREVRVSSAERVIFPASDHGPEITKREVVEYYVAVADGIVRALRDRPTALERWPKGVLPGMTLTARDATHGRGPQGDAFYQKRLMRGMPEWARSVRVHFPSGRVADELCPDHVAVVAWAAQMGTVTFHPWPVRRADVDRPDELRIDLDPHGATGFADAVREAEHVRALLEELGLRGFPKTSGKNGVHVYVRIEPRRTFTDVRHAAIALGRELERRSDRLTTAWWKEERGDRIFVDVNQNARDRTIASAYSLRPKQGAPVSFPLTWEGLAAVDDPMAFTLRTVPDLLTSQGGDAWADIDAQPHSLEPLLDLWRADLERGLGDMPYPPEYPKMPGEPKRVQPSKDTRNKVTKDAAT